MRWYCRGNKNNGALIASMGVMIACMSPAQHASHGRWWLAGIGVGVLLGTAIVVLVKSRRCV